MTSVILNFNKYPTCNTGAIFFYFTKYQMKLYHLKKLKIKNG